MHVLMEEDALDFLAPLGQHHYIGGFRPRKEIAGNVGRLSVVERLIRGQRPVAFEGVQIDGSLRAELGPRVDLSEQFMQAFYLGREAADARFTRIAEEDKVARLDPEPLVPLAREGGRRQGQGGEEKADESTAEGELLHAFILTPQALPGDPGLNSRRPRRSTAPGRRSAGSALARSASRTPSCRSGAAGGAT